MSCNGSLDGPKRHKAQLLLTLKELPSTLSKSKQSTGKNKSWSHHGCPENVQTTPLHSNYPPVSRVTATASVTFKFHEHVRRVAAVWDEDQKKKPT